MITVQARHVRGPNFGLCCNSGDVTGTLLRFLQVHRVSDKFFSPKRQRD